MQDGPIRNYSYPWLVVRQRLPGPLALMPNPSTFSPLPNPRNAAVAEEPVKRAVRPGRPQSPGTQAEYQVLATKVENHLSVQRKRNDEHG